MSNSQQENKLVAALQGGDESAYVQLINEYGGAMLAVARRYMRTEDDARDCFQDACLQVVRAIGKFEQRSSLKTWVHRIVVNECLMRLRKQGRSSAKETEFDESNSDYDEYGFRVEPTLDLSQPVDSLLAKSQNRTLVLESINKLPEDFRNVLLLRDIEEYSTRDTATLLEVSEAVVKTRLHRARSALKKSLEPLFATEA